MNLEKETKQERINALIWKIIDWYFPREINVIEDMEGRLKAVLELLNGEREGQDEI